MMEVINSVDAMQAICRRHNCEGRIVRLVPTMGSLHAGHAALIQCAINDEVEPTHQCNNSSTNASEQSEPSGVIVVVSIFVNPLQFNDREDFIKYPVAIERDLELCKELNVSYVFMPSSKELVDDFDGGASRRVSTISRDGRPISNQSIGSRCVTLKPPDELSRDLEGKSRPNHFEGMLTIVCKLFNIVQPSSAYFGLKDYQQLVLVEQMVRDLNMPTKIRPVETVREPRSQLPLSSRNVRLTEDQKQVAANLMYGTLMDSKQSIEEKCCSSRYDDSNDSQPTRFRPETILMGSLLAAQSCYMPLIMEGEDAAEVDYFELRCAKDLSVIDFDEALNLYDCQRACVRASMQLNNSLDDHQKKATILEARLLISVLVGRVRLLDNMAVRLNL